MAAEDGQAFVKNGSRDRFGNLRKNAGGRPKKIVDPAQPKAKTPAKKIGQTEILRKEYHATEKIAMIDRYRELEDSCRKRFGGETADQKKLRQEMLNELVKGEIPAMAKKDFREQLFADEDLWRTLIADRQLGLDLHNPQIKLRGAHSRGGASRHGNKLGVGYRRSGAGRPLG